MSPARSKQPVVRERGRKQRIGFGGWLARLLALGVLLWLSGFLWFSLTLPDPEPKATKTDAVVVLTGGKGRLKRGLAVIEAGGARRMLVSGVDRGTTRKQLAAAAGVSKQRLGTTDLGYEAVDTKSNAEETARWPARVTVIEDAVPVEPKAPSIATEYSKYLLRRIALATRAAT